MPIDFIQTGADVKAARRHLGLSIPEFADLLGMTPRQAEAMEHHVTGPKAKVVEWLANESPPRVASSTDMPVMTIRETLNLSQGELSYLFDTSRSVIYRWDRSGAPGYALRALTWFLQGFRPEEWPPQGVRGGFQGRNWLRESRGVRPRKAAYPNKRAAGRQFLR